MYENTDTWQKCQDTRYFLGTSTTASRQQMSKVTTGIVAILNRDLATLYLLVLNKKLSAFSNSSISKVLSLRQLE